MILFQVKLCDYHCSSNIAIVVLKVVAISYVLFTRGQLQTTYEV